MTAVSRRVWAPSMREGVAGGIASSEEPCAKVGGSTWSAPRMVAAKLSAPSTTSSIIEQPSSANAQARMAGQALCWQAAIMAMAMHSSRQKPSQSTAPVLEVALGVAG